MIPAALRRSLCIAADIDPAPTERLPRTKGSTSAGFSPATAPLANDHFGALQPFAALPSLRYARHQHDPRVILLDGVPHRAPPEVPPTHRPPVAGDVAFNADGELVLDARAGAAAVRLLTGDVHVVILNEAGDLRLYPLPAPAPIGPAKAVFAGLDVEPALLERAAALAARSPLHTLAAAGLILRAWTPRDARARVAALLAGGPPAGAAARVDAWLQAQAPETLLDWAERAASFIQRWNERALAPHPSADLLEDRDTCASLAAVLDREPRVPPLPTCAPGDDALRDQPALRWPPEHAQARWLDAVRAADPDAWWAAAEWRV